jgi:hypothetical protein
MAQSNRRDSKRWTISSDASWFFVNSFTTSLVEFFPREVIIRVLAYCDVRTHQAFGATSKPTLEIIKDPSFEAYWADNVVKRTGLAKEEVDLWYWKDFCSLHS